MRTRISHVVMMMMHHHVVMVHHHVVVMHHHVVMVVVRESGDRVQREGERHDGRGDE